jgi:hypothetical protein
VDNPFNKSNWLLTEKSGFDCRNGDIFLFNTMSRLNFGLVKMAGA